MELYTTSYHTGTKPEQLMEDTDRMAAAVKKWLAENPDANVTHMAVTGVSGQALAWPVSYKIGLPVLVVRKDGEKNYSGIRLVGAGELHNYIILDDLISSGATIKAIAQAIRDEWEKKMLNNGHSLPLDEATMPRAKAIFLSQSCLDTTFELNGADIPKIGTCNG